MPSLTRAVLRYTHGFWPIPRVNKAMFIDGYNTERTTTTAASPASPTRHENASSHDCPASRIPSNSHPTSLAPHHFSHAIPAISNRHTSRLENAISCRRQTIATRSNRQFFAFPSAELPGVISSDRLSLVARLTLRRVSRTFAAISNRQWQILENDVSHRKQTFATRSNRQLFAMLKPAFARVICSDRPSHNAPRAPLPQHYNLGVVLCRAHAPKPLTTP